MFNTKISAAILALLSGSVCLAVLAGDARVDAAPRSAPRQTAQAPGVHPQPSHIAGGRTHALLARPELQRRPLFLPAPQSSSAACGAPVTDHPLASGNGPLIDNVQLYNVGWGPVQNGPALNQFASWLASSWYVANLGREYSTRQGRIGAGRFVRALAAPGRPGDVVRDSDIRSEIEWLILHGQLPTGGPDNAFFFYLPPHVTAMMSDGTPSCHPGSGRCFCAYHGWYPGTNGQPRFYAVMPDLAGAPGWCGGPGDDLGDRTVAASHELAEMITDPSGISWVTRGGNEIGDVCNGSDGSGRINRFRTAATRNFWVQCEFSNRQNGCVDNL
ncbi:MAG TPA: hypothetical protein VHW23_39960 [Kofleriaceae bacterium]|nr:hypothetical protein [Kofleriaceae bacterium]